MKFLKKISDKISASGFQKQVKWHWRFGTKTEDYVLEYTSEPVQASILEKIFDYLLKNDKIVDYDSLPLDEWFVLDKNNWKKYESKIVGIFPRVKIVRYTLLTKKLDSLAIKKTFDGLIIKGELKGVYK